MMSVDYYYLIKSLNVSVQRYLDKQCLLNLSIRFIKSKKQESHLQQTV